jgi:2-dehydro-3-deoxygalactonokinase
MIMGNTLVAVDWGTSSLRGARLAADGQVLEEQSFGRGILSVSPGEFAAVFEACFAPWMDERSTCLISGMAGSRQGWAEAAYCRCPAGFGELAEHLLWNPPGAPAGRVAIVPGMSCTQDDVPDVMRGEEIQIFGALRLTGLQDGIFVLPGTHSKWARVRHGRIAAFRTFMTGEFYALLGRQSLLSRTVDTDAPFDGAAFDEGVMRAFEGRGLLHTAFGARTLGLLEGRAPAALGSYLSGLLIGEELRQALADTDTGEPVLIGAPQLTAHYARALSLRGRTSRSLHDQATWAGLHALAQQTKLL